MKSQQILIILEKLSIIKLAQMYAEIIGRAAGKMSREDYINHFYSKFVLRDQMILMNPDKKFKVADTCRKIELKLGE